MVRIKMRSFTKNDWNSMSGAEKFPNGSNPIINWGIRAMRGEFTLIADGDGLQFLKYTKKGYTVAYNKKKRFKNPTEARRYIEHVIKVPISRFQLKELGFKRIL